jgi:hypothetical protein
MVQGFYGEGFTASSWPYEGMILIEIFKWYTNYFETAVGVGIRLEMGE